MTSEQIGFHKGALSTLFAERNELVKLISIVDAFIQAHIKSLEKLGVDIKAEIEKAQKEAAKKKK
ncbi:hypothetical protein HZA33_05265 [Candidatus Pacearchaeota archaeon]|nr:hypothetical protein [Candidatus Pacearchaeota archaeon]